jgi:hypothetical protein
VTPPGDPDPDRHSTGHLPWRQLARDLGLSCRRQLPAHGPQKPPGRTALRLLALAPSWTRASPTKARGVAAPSKRFLLPSEDRLRWECSMPGPPIDWRTCWVKSSRWRRGGPRARDSARGLPQRLSRPRRGSRIHAGKCGLIDPERTCRCHQRLPSRSGSDVSCLAAALRLGSEREEVPRGPGGDPAAGGRAKGGRRALHPPFPARATRSPIYDNSLGWTMTSGRDDPSTLDRASSRSSSGGSQAFEDALRAYVLVRSTAGRAARLGHAARSIADFAGASAIPQPCAASSTRRRERAAGSRSSFRCEPSAA